MSSPEEEHRDDQESFEDVNYDNLLEELDSVLSPGSDSGQQEQPTVGKRELPAEIDDALDTDFQFTTTADELEGSISRPVRSAKTAGPVSKRPEPPKPAVRPESPAPSPPAVPPPSPPKGNLAFEPVVDRAEKEEESVPIEEMVVHQHIHSLDTGKESEREIVAHQRESRGSRFDYRRLTIPLIGVLAATVLLLGGWYLIRTGIWDMRSEYELAQRFHAARDYAQAAEHYWLYAQSIEAPEKPWHHALRVSKEAQAPQAFFLAGSCWELAGDIEAATGAYLNVATNYPEDDWAPLSLFALGKISLHNGRTMLGEAYLSQLIRKYPENFLVKSKEAHFELASGYEDSGVFDKAMETYEQVGESPLREIAERAREALVSLQRSMSEQASPAAVVSETGSLVSESIQGPIESGTEELSAAANSVSAATGGEDQ